MLSRRVTRANFLVPVPRVDSLEVLNGRLTANCQADLQRQLRGKSACCQRLNAVILERALNNQWAAARTELQYSLRHRSGEEVCRSRHVNPVSSLLCVDFTDRRNYSSVSGDRYFSMTMRGNSAGWSVLLLSASPRLRRPSFTFEQMALKDCVLTDRVKLRPKCTKDVSCQCALKTGHVSAG